jgi:hypothetical protein
MRAMVETGAFATPTGLPFGTLTLANRSWDSAFANEEKTSTGTEKSDTVNVQNRYRGSVTEYEYADDDFGVYNDDALLPLPPSLPDFNADGSNSPLFAGIGVQTRGGYAYNPSWIGGASSTSEVSTLQLELAVLSDRTGVREYHELGQRAMRLLSLVNPADGLFPIYMDPLSGGMKDAPVSLGARGDSLYEYLLKQWLLMGGWNYERKRAFAGAKLAVEIISAKKHGCKYNYSINQFFDNDNENVIETRKVSSKRFIEKIGPLVRNFLNITRRGLQGGNDEAVMLHLAQLKKDSQLVQQQIQQQQQQALLQQQQQLLQQQQHLPSGQQSMPSSSTGQSS